MMLFWKENWYGYELKISEPLAHRLKESLLDELKDAICQKVAEMTSSLSESSYLRSYGLNNTTTVLDIE